MKKTILILLKILWLAIISAVADVKFEVFYTDKEGEGFHIRPEAREALEGALAMVGSWLDHDAVVRIEAKSFIDPNVSSFALTESNNAFERLTPGIHHTHLASKILFNECIDENYDATLRCNFAKEKSYAFGDVVLSNQYDFKAIIIHEITHALGFNSWIEDPAKMNFSQLSSPELLEVAYFYYQNLNDQNKKDKYGKVIEKLLENNISPEWILVNYKAYKEGQTAFTYFDTFLADEEGKKVVDMKNLKFLRDDLFKLKNSNFQKNLYFLIPKGNYNYRLNGMDSSHFEKITPTVMQAAVTPGPGVRQWSEEEREIMQALGYKLKPLKRGAWIWKE